MFPQGPTPPFYPVRNFSYSPRANSLSTSMTLGQTRYIPMNAQQTVQPHILNQIKQENEKGLEILGRQVKLMAELNEIQQIDDLKSKIPGLISNLKELSEHFLNSNKGINQIIESSHVNHDENMKKNSEMVDKASFRNLEEKISNLIQENQKIKALHEQLEKDNIENMNKKGKEIEGLIESMMKKDEELEKLSKLKVEKEAIEKNIEKLVSLNEKVKKNYEQSIIDLDVHKSRLNILMDINSELRDSLEIVLHENRKLNRILSPSKPQKKNSQEE